MSNTDVAERPAHPIVEVRHQLEKMETEFANALPAHIPVERFMRVVMTSIQNNSDLLKCERRSLWNAAMRAAQDGLLPDGREGAMVVRKDKRSSTGYAVTWQPMIAGIRKKARNSGEIATWDAHVVCANDHFQFQLGDAPQINHAYDLRVERGPIVGAYSVCTLKDGTKSYEVMSIGEIHTIRDRSDAWRAFKGGFIKSTPWSSDEGEMCRKTVARRHAKVIPMSTDLDDLIRRDDDLYDFDGARDDAQNAQPRSLAGKLDALAALPSSDAPSIGEFSDTDADTNSDETAAHPGSSEAEQGEVDPQTQAEPGSATASSQGSTRAAPAAASGRGAAKSDNPPSSKDKAAPKAGDEKTVDKPADQGDEAAPPKNEAEYIAYATKWIEALDDADEGEARWKSEKSLRNKANVGSDQREDLQAKLAAKCADIRDADRS